MLFHNGCIYVGWQDDAPVFQHWMVTEGDVIVALGCGPGPEVDAPAAHDRVDLQGRLVLPGLHDSHCHVGLLGQLASSVDLKGCASIGALQAALAAYLRTTAPLPPVIVGVQWDEAVLGRLPTRWDLDAVVSDRPCLLHRHCYHVLVANSCALERCGVTAQTTCAGGVIDHDAAGQPTGVLREAAAALMDPVLRTPTTLDQDAAALRAGLQQCLQNGITSVQTNDGSIMGYFRRPWAAYTALAGSADGLPVRVLLTLPAEDVLVACQDPDHKPELLHPVPWSPDRMVSCDRVKLFADGALGASTAALDAPYSDDPAGTNVGILTLSLEEMTARMAAAKARGFRVEVHAIGDRGARVAVEAMAAASLNPEDRPVLTHCQLLHPSTVAAMARLGVVANVQPQFIPSDSPIAYARLGSRMDWEGGGGYAVATLLGRGVVVAGGSDAPVETPTPLMGMHCAITREGYDGSPLRKSEAVTFPEALGMYTTAAAFCGRQPGLGRLAPGCPADFVVLSHNVALEPSALKAATAEEVWTAGRLRYRRPPHGPDATVVPLLRDGPGKAGLLGRRPWGRCPCCAP